jgi:heat shock protein HtpX
MQALSQRAGLAHTPTLYYVRSPITNAFAVGQADDAAIAVTDGLLRRLTVRQIVGVIAHEISHVRAGDTSIMGFSDAISRLVQGLSYFGMLTVLLTLPVTLTGDLRPLLVAGALVVLPSLTTFLQLALSRSREYDADLEAATLTGDPEGLAAALEVLERADGRLWERIMVPHGRVPDPLLLRTHPPTAERTRRLRSLLPAHPPHR